MEESEQQGKARHEQAASAISQKPQEPHDAAEELGAERLFHQQLRTLFDVEQELARAVTFDDLCREAVRLGLDRLGFERMSLWFVGETPGVMHGSFGTDETGAVRDERGATFSGHASKFTQPFLEHHTPLIVFEDHPLGDEKGEIQGRGVNLTAALWDGGSVIGHMYVDNLLRHTPFTEHRRELLALYASMVGSLCSRKRAEAHLRESEGRFRAMADSAPVLLWLTDGEGVTNFFNAGWLRFTGRTMEQELRGGWLSNFHPADYQRCYDLYCAHLQAQRPYQMEYRLRRHDGEYRWLLENVVPRFDASGVFIGFIGSCIDITDQKNATEALRSGEEKYRSVVSALREGVVLQYADGGIGACNASAEQILGLTQEQMLGRTLLDPPWRPVREDGSPYREEEHPAVRCFQTGEAQNDHIMGVHKPTGERVWLSVNVRPLLEEEELLPNAVVVSFTDITDLRHSQEQLLQAQKMDSLGRLAGGIAHDFNNLLTAILGFSELARRVLPSGSMARGYLENIQQAGEQASALTGQLLAFARRQVIAPRLVSPNGLIQEMEPILLRLLHKSIEVQTHLKSEVGRVKIDPGQFHQILINLVVNARDAMPRGGALTIETEEVTTVEADLEKAQSGDRQIPPGRYVVLSVSDTGTGIEANALPYIFEPFYTTKEAGKGTGLGLSTCHGIVKQNGGYIWVYSESERGTTFKIFLPRAEETEERSGAREAYEEQDLSGGETLLVVDDDPLLREFAETVLQEQGYRVIAASGGPEALRLARGFEGRIDLVITDITMPETSGKELAIRLTEDRPELHVLYTSGYTEHTVIQRGEVEAGIFFLQKPFHGLELARKVREVLDAK